MIKSSLVGVLAMAALLTVSMTAAATSVDDVPLDQEAQACIPIASGGGSTTYICDAGEFGCVGIAVKEESDSSGSQHTNYAGICERGNSVAWCTGTFDTEEGTDESCFPDV